MVQRLYCEGIKVTTCIEKQDPVPFPLHELLADLRAGLSEGEVAAKYGLNPCIFEGRKTSTSEKHKGKSAVDGVIEPSAHDPSNVAVKEDLAESSFICPACLTSFGVMFDICPNCAASVQEAVAKDTRSADDAAVQKHEPTSDPIKEECRVDAESPRQSKPENKPKASSVPDLTGEQVSSLARETAGISRTELDASTNRGRHEHKTKVGTEKISNAQNRNRPLNNTAQDTDHKLVASPSLRCDSCQSLMAPALRDIYDRTRSLHAILSATICFLIAFLCCVMLNFLDGPSLSRITVFFFGCLTFLMGGILMGIGAFMYLAREKVYFCPRCKKTYPRADISYITAALVLSAKRAVGSW